MTCLSRALLFGSAVFAVACGEATAPELAPSIPSILIVPHGQASRGFAGALDQGGGTRFIVTDTTAGGVSGDSSYTGSTGGTGSSGGGSSGPSVVTAFTEAWFKDGMFFGHALMTYTLADQASETMNLKTTKDGSTVGSQDFTASFSYPIPIASDSLGVTGSMFAPTCGAQGLGTTQHSVSGTFGGLRYGRTATTQSNPQYQVGCPSPTPTGEYTTTDSGSGGVMVICHKQDWYSASGEYLYTETLYCETVNVY